MYLKLSTLKALRMTTSAEIGYLHPNFKSFSALVSTRNSQIQSGKINSGRNGSMRHFWGTVDINGRHQETGTPSMDALACCGLPSSSYQEEKIL